MMVALREKPAEKSHVRHPCAGRLYQGHAARDRSAASIRRLMESVQPQDDVSFQKDTVGGISAVGCSQLASQLGYSVRRKLQLPLNRLKARLFAQGIEERLGLQVLEPGITQAHGDVEPLKRLGAITPLRVDGGVLEG